jgi:tRNA A-37 threonylcarbamoyl transferase component Bud32
LRPQYSRSLQGVLGRIDDLESLEGYEPMAASMVRRVGRLRAEGGLDVVIKRFEPCGLARALVMSLRGSQWEREWRAAHHLLGRGLETPVPLALGCWRRRGLARRGALITETVADGVSLGEALGSRGLRGDSGWRLGVLQRAAQFIARVHGEGVFHGDLHAGNLLVAGTKGDRLYLLDLHRVRWGRRLTWGQRLWNLAQLLGSLGDLDPGEETGFVRAYLAREGGGREPGSVLGTLKGLREGMARRHQRSRTRRCLVESSGFVARRSGQWRFFARRGFPLGAFPRILQDARSVICPTDGRSLKLARESRVTAHLTHVGGRPLDLCVKEYPYRGLLHAVRCSIKPSRARAFWKGCWGLRVRGFGVPDPHLMWERRRLGVLLGCGVITEMVRLGRGMDRYVRETPPSVWRPLIPFLAETLARMHATGVFHRDLKAGNVLIEAGGQGRRVVFLDLEAVRFPRRVSWGARVLNLAQLDASLPSEVGLRDRLRFLSAYGGKRWHRDQLRALARETARMSGIRRKDCG